MPTPDSSVDAGQARSHGELDNRRCLATLITLIALLGRADGVRARVSAGHVVVRFTGRSARAFRAIAGHRVSFLCVAMPASLLIGAVPSTPSVVGADVRVPRHGGVLRLPSKGANDLCEVSAPATVTVVTPTSRGRKRAAELTDVAAFSAQIPDSLAGSGATAYPTAAAIVARTHRLAHGKQRLAALPTPGSPVRHGTVGIWTDGARRAVLATADRRGHRLELADEGSGVVRSNILPFLLDTLAILVLSP